MKINMVILEGNFKYENRNVSNFFLCRCMCMVCTFSCVHTLYGSHLHVEVRG